MLYLSIALVLSGILILIYSLFFRSDVSDKRYDEYRNIKDDSNERDVQPVPDEYYYTPIKEDYSYIPEEKSYRNEAVDEVEMFPYAQKDDYAEKKSQHSERTAVLYEDSSNVLNYSNQSGTIDPSLEEYKKIKRVGKGRAIVENDGISFYVDKKFFRFDFHKISDIKSGHNYIAVFMKGSDSIKLFIFLKESDYIDSIVKSYQDHS